MSSIKCPHCGKEIPEDLIAGAIENAQTTESVDDAPATNEIAVEECDEGSPAIEQETPFVVPLISDAPSESEATDEYDADDVDDDEEYLNIIKDCAIINVLAVLLFVGGIASLLLINEWLAAVMFLVAEIFALVPNEKLMKLCKAKNTSADKKTQNTIVKETRKRIKAKNNDFKFSFVIAYICLACLIISFIIPVPLIGINSNNADNINSGSNNYDDVAVNGNVQGESDDSSSGVNDGYAVDVVVGGYDYLLSTNLDATAQVSPSYPYASYLNFNEDGTGNLTVKTGSSSSDFGLYETTWEYIGMENDMRKYLVTLHTDEFVYVYYVEEKDICLMNAGTSINGYTRVRGSAQDNISGVTTSSVYDIESKSYDFAYKYDPKTGEKITTVPYPYVNSLMFGAGNMFITTLLSSPASSNSSGMEMFFGEWRYVKTENGNHYYRIDLEDGTVWNVKYLVSQDMCVMVHNDGFEFYFELSVEV